VASVIRRAVFGRVRWWHARLVQDNRSVRRSYRVEAVLVFFAIAVAAIAVPIAANTTDAFYAANLRTVADEASTHRAVDAVAITGSRFNASPFPRALSAEAQWQVGATPHRGAVQVHRLVAAGDHLRIWIDSHGHPTTPPGDQKSARADAKGAAIVVWLTSSALCVVVTVIARIPLVRIRHREWDRELQLLLYNDDGWARWPG
jgi:hypothetical protein